MKPKQNQKGFVLSTEMIIGIIAVILVASAISLLASNPGNQIDSKINSQIQVIFNTQTHLLTNGTMTSSPGAGEHYCYALHWEGIPRGSPNAIEEKKHCEGTP